jgi:hypothetical protein
VSSLPQAAIAATAATMEKAAARFMLRSSVGGTQWSG